MLLLACSTVDAQIKRGSSSPKKIERTQKKSETKTGKEKKKTVQKQKRSSKTNDEVLKDLTELGLTDPVKAWSYKSSDKNVKYLVEFEYNKISIPMVQRANVERVAAYLKNHPEAICTIKGYASPGEGSLDHANLLSGNRAASVRDMLVDKYCINPNRI